MGEAVHLRVLTGVDFRLHALAGAEEVRVGEVAVEDEALRGGVAEATTELPRQTLLQREVHVDEVRRALHRFILEFHLLDERQTLQTFLGTLHCGVGQPRAFELAHFAPHRHVVDAFGAQEVHMAHVDAVARLHEEGDIHRLLVWVRRGHRFDLGEGIAVCAKAQVQQFLRLRHELAVEGLAFLHQQEVAQFRFSHRQIAGNLHFGNLVNLAFRHVHRDEDVVLGGRNGHLGRIDLEVGVAAVHVERTQLLDVAGERFLRVAVVLLVPAQPVRGLQFEGLADFLVRERGVADDIDLADACALSFLDLDRDLHLVTGNIVDLHIHLHRVLAAAKVLVCEVAGHVFQHRAVEGLARGQAHIAQALLQVFRLDVLVAIDGEAFDGRALLHHHHQRVTFTAQFHIAEEARGIQSTQGFIRLRPREAVPDGDRQVVEHRAFGNTLQAFYLEVGDGKFRIGGDGILGGGARGPERGTGTGEQGQRHGVAKAARGAAGSQRRQTHDVRFLPRLTEVPRNVIIERQAHQHGEQEHTCLLRKLLHPLRERAPLHPFRQLEHHLAPIEHRDRQQIEHG